jgi:hypothetical protein
VGEDVVRDDPIERDYVEQLGLFLVDIKLQAAIFQVTGFAAAVPGDCVASRSDWHLPHPDCAPDCDLCLLPFSLHRNETTFIAWAGLRGAVSILLAILPIVGGLAEVADLLGSLRLLGGTAETRWTCMTCFAGTSRRAL